jgi:cell wall-associated NlpC family hydrolase
MRRVALGALIAGLAVLVASWLALGASDHGRAVAKVSSRPAQADLPPLPNAHPHLVQPVAGGAAPAAAATPDFGKSDPAPTGPATSGGSVLHAASGGSGAVSRATAVRQIIEAGNAIARTPYLWGGGHGKWLDTGYDCSGSVSFVLAAAGLLGGPLDSGHLMSWGQPGKGRWVTIYANAGHVFLEVAGIRFDTGAQSVTGSRWASDGRSTAGFVARHPAGL